MQKATSEKAVKGTLISGLKTRKKAVAKKAIAKKTVTKKAVAKAEAAGDAVHSSPHAKRIRNYKKHARQEISEAFPEIVDVLVERAKEGSLTHAKFLFDIGGVKDAPLKRDSHKRQRSLAEMLLEEVSKRREERSAEELVLEEKAV